MAYRLPGRLARDGRLAALAEVLLSRTRADLTIGSALRFSARGRHAFGEHGEWELVTPSPG